VTLRLPFWLTPLQAFALVTNPRLGLQHPKWPIERWMGGSSIMMSSLKVTDRKETYLILILL